MWLDDEDELPPNGTKANILMWLCEDYNFIVLDGPHWSRWHEATLVKPVDMPDGLYVVQVRLNYELTKNDDIKLLELVMLNTRPVPVPMGQLLRKVKFEAEADIGRTTA